MTRAIVAALALLLACAHAAPREKNGMLAIKDDVDLSRDQTLACVYEAASATAYCITLEEFIVRWMARRSAQ